MQQYRKYLWSPDMEATYLSRSISKMLEAEEPVGDPFGGAAYGRCEIKNLVKKAAGAVINPIAKVVGEDGVKILLIAGAIVTGGASLAAFGAGSIFAGIAYAGTTLSLVGTATGNERLSKIGNAVALAGGVAAVAQGGFAALQKPLDESVSSLSKTLGIQTGPGTASVSGQSGVAGEVAEDVTTNVLKEVGEEGAEAALVEGAAGGAEAAGGINRSFTPDLSQTPGGGLESLGTRAANTSAITPAGSQYSLNGAGVKGGIGFDPSFNPAPVASASTPGSGGFINSALTFAKDNPTIAFMAGNTAVSAIGGAAEASAKEDSENKARQQALDDRQFYNDSINGYDLRYDYNNVQSPYANQPQQLNQFQPPPQLVYDPQQQRYVPARPQQGLIANNMQRPAA